MALMKELDEENKYLKKMHAGKSMQNDLLKEALRKSGEADSKTRDGRVGSASPIRQDCVGLSVIQHRRDLLPASTQAQ